MDEIILIPNENKNKNENENEVPSLHKVSRAGGPVTCVSLRHCRRQQKQASDMSDNGGDVNNEVAVARIWALGPYLHCSYNYNNNNNSDGTIHTKEELLVFPQHQGGSIHGISFRDDDTKETTRTTTNDDDDDDSIKAILCTSWDAVVYGGKQLAFCSILNTTNTGRNKKMKRLEILHNHDNNDGVRTKSQLLLASDWIWDVKVVPNNHQSADRSTATKSATTAAGSSIEEDDASSCIVVLGLARHTIELWSVSNSSSHHLEDGDDEGEVSLIQVTCQRRIAGSPSCLVMSMNMLLLPNEQQDNHHPRRLWVAAGTAFQVIQVWSVSLDDFDNDEAENEQSLNPTYCLEGHAGVIHSVQFSHDGRYIASTSDDRSVRLWSCENIVTKKATTTTTTATTTTTTTSSPDIGVKWVGWGHTARIWSVAFALEDDAVIVSVAEDATARIWSLESGATLACIHHSTGLWSVATFDDMALVGATDGTVSVYNLARRIPGRELEVLESISIPDDRRPTPTNVEANGGGIDDDSSSLELTTKKKKQSRPRKVQTQVIVGMKWIHGGGNILVATRGGSLMVWNMETRQWNFLEPWWVPTVLMESHGIAAMDGCCMEVLFMDWVAIGTTRGHVVLVKLDDDDDDDSKVQEESPHCVLAAQSLKSVKGLEWIAEQRILVSFHVRSVALWVFPDENGEIESMSSPSITLNMDTKGVPISCAYDVERKQVLVGDSRGNIALFEITIPSPENNGSPTIDASSLIPRVHQKEHVTSISLVGDKIISSGNDGCLHTSYRNGSSLQRGLSIPVWSMSGITRLWFDSNSIHPEKYIAAGYYGNNYRVVDVSSGHEFFQIDTGGRQRIHDFHMSVTEDGKPGLKQMAICMNQKDGTNSLMMQREVKKTAKNPSYTETESSEFQEGLSVHGETIFDACFFSLGKKDHATFLLTASEDCGSKISLCHENHLTSALALTPQESCVRAVCTSQIDRTSALLVVGGGKLALQFFLATARNEDGLAVSSLDDVGVYFLGKGHGFASSIDQRINAAEGVPLGGPFRTHMVVAGDSAGQCHLNLISEDTSVRPPPGLVLQVCSRPILCLAMSPVGNRVLLVIGTTAGDVQLYDLPGSATDLREDWSKLGSSPWTPLKTFQAHQMGTNSISLSIAATSDTTTSQATIFTGGDDQAVSLFRLKLRFTLANASPLSVGEPITFTTTTRRDASFSAIKGVSGAFRLNLTDYFLTTGYTQQLALWRLVESSSDDDDDDDDDDAGPRLEVVKHLPVDVGDINTLATTTCVGDHHGDGIFAAVAGLGIELFRLHL